MAGDAEQGESATEAARREMREEAGIPSAAPLLPLDAKASVPVTEFHERDHWGPGRYVVTEHAFGVLLEDGQAITLSSEHTEFRWLPYEDALALLRWDSNRTALWELNERLRRRHGAARHLRLIPSTNSIDQMRSTDGRRHPPERKLYDECRYRLVLKE